MNKILLISFTVISSILLFSNCEKEGKCGVANIAQAGGSKSHNFGMNCMNCHKSGGEGKGCFSVAGSVSNATLTAHVTGGTVKFYTQANGAGQLMYTLPIDAKGNFYTTESMNITGLYPVITSTAGATASMSTGLSTGQCNSCHGSSTSGLYAN
jgi:hypothetical protein